MLMRDSKLTIINRFETLRRWKLVGLACCMLVVGLSNTTPARGQDLVTPLDELVNLDELATPSDDLVRL